MNEIEIEVWQNDNGDACCWGTHDPVVAEKAYTGFIESEMGFDREDEDWVDAYVSVEEWSKAAKRWAAPAAKMEEVWPTSAISSGVRPGWVPYMWVVR